VYGSLRVYRATELQKAVKSQSLRVDIRLVFAIPASDTRSMISPFPWPGGKRALVPHLLKMIPTHRNYVEVFAGSAKLLFAKEPSTLEVLNDLNGDVVNFFRIAKHRPAELAEALEHECVHAARFLELSAEATPDDELDRALRFAYLTWYSFGGKGTHFARPTVRGRARKPLDSVRGLLEALARRLSAVCIEQKNFAEILARFDAEETFFYLDPPYLNFGSNDRYAPFTLERLQKLFTQLRGLKARWLMSFEDHSAVRAAVRECGFSMTSVEVPYTLASGNRQKGGREVLICNYS
jgi:DNA adenine methylase